MKNRFLQCLNCRLVGGSQLVKKQPYNWGLVDEKGVPTINNLFCLRCNGSAITTYNWFWRLIRALKK